jgi:uncharacterized protein (DUF2235 family)
MSRVGLKTATTEAFATNIPKYPRNIVILLDGTGNQYGEKNSNLIKTMSVLKADENQLLYYSSGLGE